MTENRYFRYFLVFDLKNKIKIKKLNFFILFKKWTYRKCSPWYNSLNYFLLVEDLVHTSNLYENDNIWD